MDGRDGSCHVMKRWGKPAAAVGSYCRISLPAYLVGDPSRVERGRHIDSGRGGAKLWTRGPLDRETHRFLPVKIAVSDAGGLTSTQTVTVIVSDLNDNPMKPAAKTVYLWKTQGSGSDAPLGRVYVEDPDDWDVADKTFRWNGKPHPSFTLNEDDGTIFASSQVREGRQVMYELQFSVSDRVWKQKGVSANVSVMVRTLTNNALAHAAPITLTSITPADLTRGWSPTSSGGRLGKLLKSVQEVLGQDAATSKVEVVSVYGSQRSPETSQMPPSSKESSSSSSKNGRGHPGLRDSAITHSVPSACVWVSAKENGDMFMDAIKLQGLLALHSRKVSDPI
ncbi:hypothetical protein SK128_016924 [Halocaridina rubra]|uniref:Cadherin domain-containing protein n=1 Tax=Halocaridina rubra TaxID=373956 RepID=A0AAN9A1S3_HALRR